jgi:transposase
MKTLSVDLRERIMACYDAHEGTRQTIADRFRVSPGMVKKLLQQRRRTGDIRPRHHLAGRKPKILEQHRQRLKELVAGQPDMTLAELRRATGLPCSLPAIHYALAAMDLTYKKRHCGPANRTGRTSRRNARRGRASSRRRTRAR